MARWLGDGWPRFGLPYVPDEPTLRPRGGAGGLTVRDVVIIGGVVLVVGLVMMPVMMPRIRHMIHCPRETLLIYHLGMLRDCIDSSHAETGAYPAQLSDVLRPAASPPTTGINAKGKQVPINPADYRGPYFIVSEDILWNPITKGRAEGVDWMYSKTPPTVGEVRAAPGPSVHVGNLSNF